MDWGDFAIAGRSVLLVFLGAALAFTIDAVQRPTWGATAGKSYCCRAVASH